MADEDQYAILNNDGVESWNSWRRANPDAVIDLSGAALIHAHLVAANLSHASLKHVDLSHTFLGGTNFSFSDLAHAEIISSNLRAVTLSHANLIGAKLRWSHLQGTNLLAADLSHAILEYTDLDGANFSDANLRRASLIGAKFSQTALDGANLSEATLSGTIFASIDLTMTEGLDQCDHYGPSFVDYSTLKLSRNVPLSFWRGCGLPDALIDYIPSLTGDAIQFYSCFISYSSKDQEFAERLHADLQNAGVRCWFAPHDMRTGDRIRDTIDEQIRFHDKLLLILSNDSVSSNWVENEVESAIEREKDRKTVLFPVRIDDAAEDRGIAWARTIKRTRHISDFTGWKQHDDYKKAFDRLLRDLKVER